MRLQKADKLLEAHSTIYGYPYTKNQAFMRQYLHKCLIFGRGDGISAIGRVSSRQQVREKKYLPFAALLTNPTITRVFSQPTPTSKKSAKTQRFSRIFGRGDGDRTYFINPQPFYL